MNNKKFIFFLIEEDGRSRQIVNGVVTSLNAPAMLQHAPIGNQEIAIGWERSSVYYGNIRNFSLPLGFVRDGAKILRNDSYKFNIDRKLYLLVKRFTAEFSPTEFKEYYKQIYKGELDFSTGIDKQSEYRFDINIMEGGLQKLMKAAETTEFFIPFDGDAVNVKMDGMYIKGVVKMLVTEQNILLSSEKTVQISVINTEGSQGVAFFSVFNNAPVTDFVNDINYFMLSTLDVTGVNIKWNIAFTEAETDFEIWLKTNTGRVIPVASVSGDPVTQIVVDQTIDLFKDEKFFLTATGNVFNTLKFGEAEMLITFETRSPTSYIQGFTLYDLGRKLVEKATGNADNFQSSLLLNEPIVVTSGDGVRGLPQSGVKVSWREYFKAVDVYYMAGMKITESKVIVEHRSEFYKPVTVTPAISLGEIKNFKSYPAVDKMFTSVKIGHAEQQVDDTNGKFDFNGWQIYTLPIKSIPAKELDLQSPWKASPYEIEQTRANYEGKITTDKETDNSVFVIAAKRDDASNIFQTTGSFKADGAPFAPGQPFLSIVAGTPQLRAGMKIKISGTALNNADLTIAGVGYWPFGQLITLNEAVVDEAGVLFTIEIIEGKYYILDRDIAVQQLTVPDVSQEIKDTVFNVPLSPKRLLQRHYPWLAGVTEKYAPASLVFDNFNRNKELIAGGIVEKADVPVAALGAPLVTMRYFEFDTKVPVNLPEILETNPDPVFDFTVKAAAYTGFMEDAGIALNTLEEQSFKLLACPDQDLLNLI